MEYSKPWTVHTERKLSEEDAIYLKLQKETYYFVYGSTLFQPDQPLFNKVVVQPTSCASDVSPLYNSATITHGKQICFACHSETVLPIPLDMQQSYKNMHLVYNDCYMNGKRPRTRGPMSKAAK